LNQKADVVAVSELEIAIATVADTLNQLTNNINSHDQSIAAL
jgi:hypothetical protein